jgi:hypothetical protein
MAITRLGPNQSINLASNITGTLATGNGGTGATSFAPGKVLQTITATTTSSTATTSTSFVVTNLTLNITPSATSSKIYVVACSGFYNASETGDQGAATIYRDSTNLGSTGGMVNTFGTDKRIIFPTTVCVLDSPNSTSQIAYAVYIRSYSGASQTLNGQGEEGQIIAMEIAG